MAGSCAGCHQEVASYASSLGRRNALWKCPWGGVSRAGVRGPKMAFWSERFPELEMISYHHDYAWGQPESS